MKYLSNNNNNNNHFFYKRKIKSIILSFQVPLSNAHVTSCLAHIHKHKKALETKVNEIIGRVKKAIQTKAHEKRIVKFYPQYFSQYFYKNHIKILHGKFLLVLI